MPEVTEFFPGNLRRLRKAAGYTQTRMGEMLGIKQESYSAWETGATRVPAYALQTLAFLLNCTLDDLLKEHPDDAEEGA